MSPNARIYGLDILRAAAILLVIFVHGLYKVQTHVDALTLWSLVPDGVSLFFVLSGYLIGTILLKTISNTSFEKRDLANFWNRRWFRTLPAYLVVLTLLVLQSYLWGLPIGDAGKYYLFLQTIKDGNCTFFLESWSLCVEEWFYLFIPLLIFLSIRFTAFTRKGIVLFWIVAIIIASTAARFLLINTYQVDSGHQWDILIRKPVYLRMDSIMYGFLGAYMSYYRHPAWKWKNLCFTLGVILLLIPAIKLLTGTNPAWYPYAGVSLESIATLLLLPKLSSLKKGRGAAYRFITFTSTISYSMYLVHGTVFNLLVEPRVTSYLNLSRGPELASDLVRLGFFTAFAFLGAYLLYRAVERPFLKARDRYSHQEPKAAFSKVMVLEESTSESPR